MINFKPASFKDEPKVAFEAKAVKPYTITTQNGKQYNYIKLIITDTDGVYHWVSTNNEELNLQPETVYSLKAWLKYDNEGYLKAAGVELVK